MAEKLTYKELEQRVKELEQSKSELVHTINTLGENEKNLRSIFENMQDVFYKLDKNGKIIAGSPSAARLYKYDSVDEIIGMHATDFIYDMDENAKFDRELQKKGSVKNFILRHKRKNGEIIYVETNSNLLLDEQGNFDGVIGVFRDVTDRKKNEKKLKKSEENLRIIFENIQDGIYRLDKKSRVISASPSAVKMYGYGSVDEVIGKHASDFGDGMEAYIESKKRIREKGYINNNILKRWKKNGERIYVEINHKLLFDDQGNPNGVIGVIRDITKRKNIEEKLIQNENHLKSLEEKTRDNIASDLHDTVAQTLALSVSRIKTLKEKNVAFNVEPLSEIQGYLEQSLDEIRQLINQLCPQIVKDFDIATVIGFLIKETNKKLDADIIFTNKTNEPIDINEAIKITLYRAVNEIILNVLKHSGVKKAKVELKKNKDNIILKIKDNGIGFDPAIIKTTQFNGFGLFSITQRCKNMGGNVKIKSMHNEGTEVKIFMPVN